MSRMDLDRAQILRVALNDALKGEGLHDIVGALEMLVVDVLTALPGLDENGTLSAFEAMARDVRNIVRERFATQGKAH